MSIYFLNIKNNFSRNVLNIKKNTVSYLGRIFSWIKDTFNETHIKISTFVHSFFRKKATPSVPSAVSLIAKTTKPYHPTSKSPITLKEQRSIHTDGSCDNFVRSEFFVPYIVKLKDLFFQKSTLKDEIKALDESDLKTSMKKLYEHMYLVQDTYDVDKNHAYFSTFMNLLRSTKKGLDTYQNQEDKNFKAVQAFIYQFVENYMMSIDYRSEGMEFLHQKGLEQLQIFSPKDLSKQLEKAYNQININKNVGCHPGLYDPFLLGNMPTTTYQIGNCKIIRCPNFVADSLSDDSEKIKIFPIGEQVELFLDSYKKTGKKHLTINMMERNSPVPINENGRCVSIEKLEQKYKGTLNTVTIDRNSEFYSQTNYANNDAQTFKKDLLTHLFSNHYYWTTELDLVEWKNEVGHILDIVHQENFNSEIALNKEARKAFIEISYAAIIDSLIKKFNPSSANFSCKSCIDRGMLTQLIFYFYQKFKSGAKLDQKDFEQILFMTFIPALLVGNRAPMKNHFDSISNALPYLAKIKQSETAQGVTAKAFQSEDTKLEKFPEQPIDTSDMSIEEQLAWRLEKFMNRTVQIKLLSGEERQKIEKLEEAADKILRQKVNQEFDNSKIEIAQEKKSEMVDAVAKHYLLSERYYGPAVMLWMDNLLKEAARNGRKPLFLARGGILMHDVAQVLLQKYGSERYGNLKKEDLKVVWLSRDSTKDLSTKGDMLKRYFKQQGIEETDPILLVDTGCTGTLKKSMKGLIKNDTEWMFSISRNPAIKGFWDNCDFSFPAISFLNSIPKEHNDSWANDPKTANTWLEDGKEGHLIGAKTFKEENGIIYPEPSMKLEGNELKMQHEVAEDPVSLLMLAIKDYGFEAVVDYAKKTDIKKIEGKYDEIKQNLNDVLVRIQKQELKVETGRAEHSHVFPVQA